LKSARLSKEVQYVIDTWQEYVIEPIWPGHIGPCFEQAQAEGKLDTLKARLVVWMMEGLRPECIRADLIEAVSEIGREFLEDEAKGKLKAWLTELEPLLSYELDDAQTQEVFEKLKGVWKELQELC